MCLYVDIEINSVELYDKLLSLSKLEPIWVLLYFGKNKYLMGCIYRPSDLRDMVEIGKRL